MKINTSTIRAASRLSPKMVAYHIRRIFRNRLGLHTPSLYKRYIDRIASYVPPLANSYAPERDRTHADLVRFVSSYYHDEYISHIDDAASGTFSFFGQRVCFGSPWKIDWHHKLIVENDLHLWRMKLAHMGFICPMLISGSNAHLQAVETIISGFHKNAHFDVPGCFTSYWFPYSASHRVLNILSGYLIARESRTISAPLQRAIEDFLRLNVGFILANIEHELKNNHVERNLAAICLYYNHVENVPARLASKIDKDVQEIISSSVLEDGMQAERSAMYQGLTVMALRIFAEAVFLSDTTRNLAAKLLPRSERAWALMTHPDGEIGLFNDSWFGEVPKPINMLPSVEFNHVSLLPQAGYARIEAGDYFALFDAGPIGPRWNPGHGHADFLSVEIDIAGCRFIVDPGTFQYSTGPRRQFERSAQSHNGPTCDELIPVEYSGCFKVGKMVEAKPIRSSAPPDKNSVAGELKLVDTTIKREIQLSDTGVNCIDAWNGVTVGAVVRLLVQDEWELVSWDKNQAVFDNESVRVCIALKQGTIEGVELGHWSKEYLHSSNAWVLKLRPTSSKSDTASLVWEVFISQ